VLYKTASSRKALASGQRCRCRRKRKLSLLHRRSLLHRVTSRCLPSSNIRNSFLTGFLFLYSPNCVVTKRWRLNIHLYSFEEHQTKTIKTTTNKHEWTKDAIALSHRNTTSTIASNHVTNNCNRTKNYYAATRKSWGFYAMILFVRLFVCRLWNLWSHWLRGSTCRRLGVSTLIHLFILRQTRWSCLNKVQQPHKKYRRYSEVYTGSAKK